MQAPLLASVFIVASCGLAYELIAGALASYLLGDSVTQFSTVIGAYLFAMGIGSWLSKHVAAASVSELLLRFIQIELLVGLLGGLSAGLLFLLFTLHAGPFRFALYGLVLLIGILVGLEIPLIMRILKSEVEFKDLVAKVLSFDYIGALAVSLLFPLLLAPHLGLVRSALLFGLLNALVAAWALWLFRERIGRLAALRAQCAVVIGLLLLAFGFAGQFVSLAEANLYNEDIVHAESSAYQRIVVTKYRDETRLYLNHNLQFSSRDEYRYHEALVHPGLASLPGARRVLVLGGGDGMAVREILKYPQVESIVLVDLDPRMTELFAQSTLLRDLNANALASPKLKIVNVDALQWLEASQEIFDFVVADFPDPSNHSLGKLYSTAFYRLLKQHVAETGRIVVQATSPLYARQSYWTVVATLEAAGWQTAPYHALVPSFGEWGYILAGRRDYRPPETIPVATRFVTPDALPALFHFPADMARVAAEPNRLDNQNLVRIFEREWGRVQAH
ncbi:polyamine aminopropyltransferase [Sulfuritalea sp.]|uniref:polyamine aminopropyltransferase n=1 Tax=Sulfuritalea sp. TaxID=2480090 RepID=UPI001AC27FBC|nr:polyamine aminopropyltransferase [Sulfuritalea sp.]MBN8476556.1 polyamine aminopropyltransferase [Sulfuritalea sp.]